jgi:UDP-N-acetylglucosamine/UDP-N-acetylgalactosamine diphosphorylase
LEWAQGRGIEHFFYAQVDNPLVRACDPRLIGLHRLAGSQVTTQVVPKRFPTERVGNVVKVDGKTQIIEYSDLPEVVASQRNEDGTLKLWAGNIAVHVFDVSFLKSCVGSRDALPFHRAKKVVSYVDVHGELQQPAEPNAIKLERFVFDLLPAAERTLVVEVLPSESFAPVKNATGAATDTPEASRQAISGLHQRWLQEAGVEIHSGVQVEIHPMWAWDAAEVLERISEPVVLKTDTYFA